LPVVVEKIMEIEQTTEGNMESDKELMRELLSKVVSLESTMLGRMSDLERNMLELVEKVKEGGVKLNRNDSPTAIADMQENKPAPLKTSKSLISSMFNKVDDSSDSKPKWTAPKGSWIKLFCHKRGANFFYNIHTKKVFAHPCLPLSSFFSFLNVFEY
jgi:hypothetical protein